MTDQDTREKLEEDLQALTESWHEYDGNYMLIYYSVAYAQIKELLDRQASITRRECSSIDWWAKVEALQDERDELLEMLDEKDELLGSATRNLDESLDDLKDMGDQLTDMENQRDELQSKLDRIDETHIALPLDADGVPIRVGDWMERVGGGGNDYTKVAKCVAVAKDAVLFRGKNIVGDAPETLIKQNKASNWRRCLVNADGEVIRKGDFVWGADGKKWLVTGFCWEHSHPVRAEDENGRIRQLKPSWCSHKCPDSLKRIADELRHVKPRTIEDVLAEFAGDVRNGKWSLDMEEKYADELRELMGGDA